MTMTLEAPATKTVLPGTVVTHSTTDGTAIYDGEPDDARFIQMKFSATGVRIRADMTSVAPANEVEVNLKDPRIKGMVEQIKDAKQGKDYPWGSGKWRARDEQLGFTTWHKLKRDAVAECARRLAIHDWHSAI